VVTEEVVAEEMEATAATAATAATEEMEAMEEMEEMVATEELEEQVVPVVREEQVELEERVELEEHVELEPNHGALPSFSPVLPVILALQAFPSLALQVPLAPPARPALLVPLVHLEQLVPPAAKENPVAQALVEAVAQGAPVRTLYILVLLPLTLLFSSSQSPWHCWPRWSNALDVVQLFKLHRYKCRSQTTCTLLFTFYSTFIFRVFIFLIVSSNNAKRSIYRLTHLTSDSSL
jgi:hypothetical protein